MKWAGNGRERPSFDHSWLHLIDVLLAGQTFPEVPVAQHRPTVLSIPSGMFLTTQTDKELQTEFDNIFARNDTFSKSEERDRMVEKIIF